MRIRLVLAALTAATLFLVTAGEAHACYTPCLGGQNCFEVCLDVPIEPK